MKSNELTAQQAAPKTPPYLREFYIELMLICIHTANPFPQNREHVFVKYCKKKLKIFAPQRRNGGVIRRDLREQFLHDF